MTFLTTLSNIELLPEGDGVSKMLGKELLDRLALVFDYLPEGTLFRVDGETVTITVPESLATQKAEAERLAEKAAQRARQGEYEKAKDIYRRVLELAPTHPNARRDLAMICVETGDNDEAKDYLIESLRLTPDDPLSHSARPGASLNRGNRVVSASSTRPTAMNLAILPANQSGSMPSMKRVAGPPPARSPKRISKPKF